MELRAPDWGSNGHLLGSSDEPEFDIVAAVQPSEDLDNGGKLWLWETRRADNFGVGETIETGEATKEKDARAAAEHSMARWGAYDIVPGRHAATELSHNCSHCDGPLVYTRSSGIKCLKCGHHDYRGAKWVRRQIAHWDEDYDDGSVENYFEGGGSEDGQIEARLDPDEYVAAVKREDIPVSYSGYYAAYIDTDGDILALEEHAVLGSYTRNYKQGRVRLVVHPPGSTSNYLGISKGPSPLTDQQADGLWTLFEGLQYAEMIVDDVSTSFYLRTPEIVRNWLYKEAKEPVMSRRSAAKVTDVVDEGEGNDAYTVLRTDEGDWKLRYDDRPKPEPEYEDGEDEGWHADFPGQRMPHSYYLEGPNGEEYQFTASGDDVVSPIDDAIEQAIRVVENKERYIGRVAAEFSEPEEQQMQCENCGRDGLCTKQTFTVGNDPHSANSGETESMYMCRDCRDRQGFTAGRHTGTNWTLDQVPIEDGFTVQAFDGDDDDMGDGPVRTFPCKNCKSKVEVWGPGEDTECPRCHTEYNAFGQELRSDWRSNPSNYDDDISDLEGYERSHRDSRTASAPVRFGARVMPDEMQPGKIYKAVLYHDPRLGNRPDGAPDVETVEFIGKEGTKVNLRSEDEAGGYEWGVYPYEGEWCYGTSAEPIHFYTDDDRRRFSFDTSPYAAGWDDFRSTDLEGKDDNWLEDLDVDEDEDDDEHVGSRQAGDVIPFPDRRPKPELYDWQGEDDDDDYGSDDTDAEDVCDICEASTTNNPLGKGPNYCDRCGEMMSDPYWDGDENAIHDFLQEEGQLHQSAAYRVTVSDDTGTEYAYDVDADTQDHAIAQADQRLQAEHATPGRNRRYKVQPTTGVGTGTTPTTTTTTAPTQSLIPSTPWTMTSAALSDEDLLEAGDVLYEEIKTARSRIRELRMVDHLGEIAREISARRIANVDSEWAEANHAYAVVDHDGGRLYGPFPDFRTANAVALLRDDTIAVPLSHTRSR